MARIRTIKPDLWSDDKFLSVSFLADLIVVGMIQFADDEGYITAKPSELNARLLGGRATVPEVEAACKELESTKWIKRHRADDGAEFFSFPNWRAHQVIAHPTPSRIKARVNGGAQESPRVAAPDAKALGQSGSRRQTDSERKTNTADAVRVWRTTFGQEVTDKDAQKFLDLCACADADPRFVCVVLAARNPKRPWPYMLKMLDPKQKEPFTVPAESRRTASWACWRNRRNATGAATSSSEPVHLGKIVEGALDAAR